MPLSKSVRWSLQHRRTVECCGYKRDDGLWDIEGRVVEMIDVKTVLPVLQIAEQSK